MRGHVVEFDQNRGEGVIEDQRGARFNFSLKHCTDAGAMRLDVPVNFKPKGSKSGPFAAQVIPLEKAVS